jgi:ATP-dependent exoDNAse (exonuclease V) beta subunit
MAFQVLRSSAGAGKTHTLVKHYLVLCLRTARPDAYRQVLALTFTNKAAAEMRARVLLYLERLARGEADSPPMRDVHATIKEAAGIDEAGVQRRAQATLEHMLHHWGDAAISTIDAFTRRVVRPFARDLRLDHELRTTTEEEWYRLRAVDDTVAKAGEHQELTTLLAAAAEQVLDDAGRWDPCEPLRQLSAELGKERSIQPLEALEHVDADAVLGRIRSMKAENAAFRSRARAIGRDALELLRAEGLTADDLSHKRSGFHGYLMKLAGFGKDWLAPGANTLKALEKDAWASGGISADAEARLRSIAPRLRQLITESLDLLASGQRAYFIRSAVLRDLPATFALRELRHCLEQRKHDDGVVFFSDLTRRVADLVRDEPAPFIFERLGERYRHYLIDEFQDTSLLQWATLLPLVQNALASGGSALLVGDAKQAIYRWRNGEARLFIELPRLFGSSGSDIDRERESALRHHHQACSPLNENHRSAANIIRFNNALFARLREDLPTNLRRVYEAHEQQPMKARDGLIHLKRLDKDITGEDAEALRARFLLACVQECLSDGFVPGDIAVLTRSNKAGRAAAAALTEAGYHVTSPDGLLLGGDPRVELLMDLLRVLWSDDAPAAARAVQRMAMIDAEPGAARIDPYADLEGAIDPLLTVKAWLTSHGILGVRTTLTALLAELLRALGIAPESDGRCLALIDEAHAFANEHGPSLPSFLEHWERLGHKRSLAPRPDPGAVQVMTIHKAKGLEFPVVILPSTRMAAQGAADRLWLASIAQETGVPYALMKPSAALNGLDIPELAEETALQQLDGLNLLYVAFTRPVQRLYAMAHERAPDTVTKGLLGWMADQGNEAEWRSGERTPPWTHAAADAGEPLTELPQGRTLNAEAIFRTDAPEAWDPLDPDRAKRLGNAAHLVLSRIDTAQDLSSAIESCIARGELLRSEADELATRLTDLLSRPDVAAWFSANARARNEAAIITEDGHALRPDRVLIAGDTAKVLDYKTGLPADAHEEQVRGYLRVLRTMGFAQVEGALLYLSTATLKRITA